MEQYLAGPTLLSHGGGRFVPLCPVYGPRSQKGCKASNRTEPSPVRDSVSAFRIPPKSQKRRAREIPLDRLVTPMNRWTSEGSKTGGMLQLSEPPNPSSSLLSFHWLIESIYSVINLLGLSYSQMMLQLQALFNQSENVFTDCYR